MELFDYAEAINKNLEIRILARPHDKTFKYIAEFENGPEIKNGIMLEGVCGYGLTADEALANYAVRISKQRLVWGSYTDFREEHETPELTHSIKKKKYGNKRDE